MKRLQDLRIRDKILAVALVGAVGFAAYLGLLYQAVEQTSSALQEAREVDFPVLEAAQANLMRLERLEELWQSAAITADEDLLEKGEELAEAVHNQFQAIIRLTPQAGESVHKLQSLFDDYYQQALGFTRAMIEGELSPSELRHHSQNLDASRQQLVQALQQFHQEKYQHFHQALFQVDQANHDNLSWGLAIGVVITLAPLAAAFFIGRDVSRGIGKITQAMSRLAEGDLTTNIPPHHSRDEIGRLIDDYNDTQAQLRELIDGVIQGVIHLLTVTDLLLGAMRKTTESVDRQRQETEHLAGIIDEMSRTVSEVTDHTRQAAHSSEQAGEQARNGHAAVSGSARSIGKLADDVVQAATTIETLARDSEAIGAVLDVIREITEQTNLLALNAAIEAARAGEQGRGFAVVADEVRTLASRTQESTREIQATIETLQNRAREAVDMMEQGRRQAKESVQHSQRAGELLDHITEAVATSTAMNERIAAAAEVLAGVSEQVQENITNINTLAQQTSDYAEDSAENARAIESTAQSLTELVMRFKLR